MHSLGTEREDPPVHAASSTSSLLSAVGGWSGHSLGCTQPISGTSMSTCYWHYLQYLWTLLGWEGPASALWWLTLCSGCCYRPHIPHLALALEHPPPVLSLTHLSLAMADTWSPVGSQLSCFPVLFSGAGWNSLVQFIPYWFCGQPWKLYSASLPAESSCAIELNFDIVTPRGMTANLEGEWLPEFQRQSLQKPSAFPPPTQQTSRFGRNQEKGD